MRKGYGDLGKKMEINKCFPEHALCWSQGPSLTLSGSVCSVVDLVDPFPNAELKSHLSLFIRLEDDLFDILILEQIWFPCSKNSYIYANYLYEMTLR